MTRRRFRPLTTGANPTLESLARRQPSRRIFRELQPGMSRPFTPLWIDYLRGITCLGPLTSDTSVAGHTQNWRWDAITGAHFNGGLTQNFANNFVWSWFSHPVPVLNTITKMVPIRFAIDGYRLGYDTVRSDLYGRAPSRRKPSSFTPPATSDGHFSGSRTTTIRIDRCLFSTNLSATASRIVAARLIVDGSDVSGPVSMSVPFSSNGNGTFRWGWFWSNALTLNVSPVVIVSAKTLFVDVWVEFISGSQSLSGIFTSAALGIQQTDGYGAPLITAHGSFSPYGGSAFGPIMTPGQIDVHRRLRLSDTWALTFTGGTVGGASSLIMQPQAGWSYTRQGPVVGMVKTSGTGAGDRVTLRYDTETPECHVQLAAMLAQEINAAGGINNGWTRYSIISPSYYLPETVSGQSLGPLTASGSNTFVPISRGAYGTGVSWQPWEQTFASQRTGFPTSIAATRP